MKLLFRPRTEDLWSAGRLKYMADAVLNAGAVRILDVGSAQVENVYLARPNLQLFCIDDWEVPPKKIAAEFRRVNVDVEGLPFESEFFDAVLAGEILEHLWSPFAFLAETNRVLRPGGMLVISTPHPHYYLEVLKTILGINRVDCDGHVNLFSRSHLSEVLRKLGFEVVEVKSTCMWFPLVRIVLIVVRP